MVFSVCTPLFLQLCILNTGYTTGLDMCKVCTAAVHSVALWTRVALQVWTHVSMYRSSPFRSTLNTGYITGVGMCKLCTEAGHCVSTLNTGYITGVDMCKVCTEAVHSVALWTRVTLQVWTCVKYVPKQSIPQQLTPTVAFWSVDGVCFLRFWFELLTSVLLMGFASLSIAPFGGRVCEST